MKNVINFLAELRLNNNRGWFEANRERYQTALGEFNAFAEELIEGIASFDPSVRGLTPKETTYRIYRDVRFSHDKSPYKTYMGTYICAGGKKSGYAGYYFHVEPQNDGILGGNILTSGLYMPDPKALKSIRDDIFLNGGRYVECIDEGKKRGFSLWEGSKLKKVAAGYPQGGAYDEYLKLKDVYIEKHVGDDYLLAPRLLERVVGDFSHTYNLVQLLNRSVEYSREQ